MIERMDEMSSRSGEALYRQILTFQTRLMDLSLDLLTAYEQLATNSETISEWKNTVSSAVPTWAPAPHRSSDNSLFALERPDLESTCGGPDNNANALMSSNSQVVKTSSSRNGALAAETTSDTNAFFLSGNHCVEMAPDQLVGDRPSLFDHAAARKTMVQGLQKKLRAKANATQNSPADEASSPTVLEEISSERTDRHTKVQSLDSNPITRPCVSVERAHF